MVVVVVVVVVIVYCRRRVFALLFGCRVEVEEEKVGRETLTTLEVGLLWIMLSKNAIPGSGHRQLCWHKRLVAFGSNDS